MPSPRPLWYFMLDYSVFVNPHFLAGVCIHCGRKGTHYRLSKAVTAALVEEAKTLHIFDNVPVTYTQSTHEHTHQTKHTHAHWLNALRQDERTNLSNQQCHLSQAWGPKQRSVQTNRAQYFIVLLFTLHCVYNTTAIHSLTFRVCADVKITCWSC